MKSIKKKKKKILDHFFGVYNVGSQNGYKIKNIIDFYFGVNAIKSTTMHYTRVGKSQTLSTKKLRALLRVKKMNFTWIPKTN